MDEEMLMQDTQPEVEAETNEALPAEPEADTEDKSAEEANLAPETEAEATAPADTSADDDAPAEAEETAPTVVRAKFNKREYTYTPEEAAPYVEMGLKWESFKTDYVKLQDLAAANGITVSELIEQSAKSADLALRKTLEEKYGDDTETIEQMFAFKKSERDRKIQAARDAESQRLQQEQEEEKNALHKRLADDFAELQTEAPGKFKEFKDIPDKVLTDAIEHKRSLYDAYLRWERKESAKSEAVKVAQEKASKTSAGSLQDKPTIENAPEIDAALKGIWGK